MDDLGAAVRSSDREVADVIARGHGNVRCPWLLVDTAANREIVRRYPAILRARFRGSSAGWVRALAGSGGIPALSGLAWVQLGRSHLGANRLGRR